MILQCLQRRRVEEQLQRKEYHLKSGRATTIETFSTFGPKQDQWLPIIDEEPCQPFSCRADFEFAELAHNAALNKDHTDELLRLIWRITEGHAKLTFKSHRDVSLAWDRAASQMTPFEKHTITARHKREDLTFDVYTRPLWDWALDLLQDPLLAPHFPWTADCWWNVQSSLPENGVPFAFILYADKMHLNTDGLGSGWMVGWLPIVPEYSKEDGKLSYVNLKQVVWNDGFLKLLETIILYAKTGYAHLCSDDARSCVELWKKDKAAGEEALKKRGLRPVMNVFWQILNSNPHKMISQDHLHVYHIGEWGKHLFGELKRHSAALGRSAEKKIDDQFAAFTRWRNLNHFDRVTNITYSNESTIQAGKAEVLVFQTHLEDYIAIIEETDPDATKNWNFPKMHASKHIFDDIITKGAACNFSTRPNKKQHGPIKRWYLRQTNHKDIANQILVLDHKSFVAEFIRSRIEFCDEEQHKLTLSREELEDNDTDDEPFKAHLHLSLPLRTLTSLAQVEEDNRSNCAFDHFRKKLATFLNHFLPSHNIPLPDGIRWLKLSAHDQVHEHHYLKVHYESAATWKMATDYLRCSPSFHGHKRCDCALIRTQDKDGHDKNIFVKLLFVFKLTVGNHTLDLALVLPVDASPHRRLLDRDLQLT
ncbi:hypothetical protein DFJ58DRAFT_719098 [Suillus subalutaceus]|uniref:uncharacterized protein n=1 Tax=Suillus subalutaceus TaxID=48586 RepID=UPI001B879A1B|nr:uncharacterized protein DFJ58DRAFT_719098 [Suillus subalutaceus]KAG1836405.1 hypothetical protein DFJ58DRAFT_719098 [Suillus subalutaceus]